MQCQHVQTEERDEPRRQKSPGNRTQPLPGQDYTLRQNIDRGQNRQQQWKDRRDTLPRGESQHGTILGKKTMDNTEHTWILQHNFKGERQKTGAQQGTGKLAGTTFLEGAGRLVATGAKEDTAGRLTTPVR